VSRSLALPAVGFAPRGQFRSIAALIGSADALRISQLAQHAREEKRLCVVLCADAQVAHRLEEECKWFAPELTTAALPDWETLPYDHFSPHQDLISERLLTMHRLVQKQIDLLIVPVTTAAHRFAPPSFHAAFTFMLKTKQKLDVNALRSQLTTAGYAHVTQVVAAGEYSVRGGLIDLFPMGASLPFRIDLFDDEIESIKQFDADSQRSLFPVPEIRLLPAREFPTDEKGRTFFRKKFREVFEGDPSRCQLYKDIGNGVVPGGVEYYLPLFFENTATLFDYLADDTVIVEHGDLYATLTQFDKDAQSRYLLLRGDFSRPLIPTPQMFVLRDAFLQAMNAFSRVCFDAHNDETTRAVPNVSIDRKADAPLTRLSEFVDGFAGTVVICAESNGRRETMADLLRQHALAPTVVESLSDALVAREKLVLLTAPLFSGFIVPTPQIGFITETELYASTARRAQRKRNAQTNIDGMLKDLSELKVGDPVVHQEHGIGRYRGLVSLDMGDGQSEFLHIDYANDAKLYVPVGALHLISRYSGMDPEHAPLHTLGSGQWEKAKRRAAMQARDTAAELLNLYAQRAARKGMACKYDAHSYDAFCAGFPFEETADQSAAIHAVVQDLISEKPMDRLVCGDVGFGKTEVALRAAFVALMDNRQVAILVPTTLLAEQHFQTFKDRLAEFPVRVAELSRFRTPKEVEAALKGIEEGTIDLVIGTHRLIQPDVKFKRLGLVIIDEEHRFGVRQKEQMKRLRAEVDVLTLTATPIPRTLAMSMEGIRDFSVIATAPQKRLAIKTFVVPYSEGIVREAITREIKRGGQVYFLHNDIETIENVRERLESVLPDVRVRVGHGQMGERELESVMRDFYHQRFQLLLCSTIIETGIDVASANTIIINRADKFGLAQLHQLRGRVGRSHHQAFAYLLTPPPEALSNNAKKRLEAISMMEELGSGFYLAMHDLEIRGAGEVLGDKQSGEMQEVGFSMFSDMLNQAVKALKKGLEPDMDEPLGVTTEVNLHTPALLPNDYCPDIHERLVIYKRLANCESRDEIADIKEELVDRFGVLPTQAEALLAAHEIRALAKPLGIKKVDSARERSIVHFTKKPTFEPIRLIELVQRDGRYRFAGPDKLKIERAVPGLTEQVQMIRDFLSALVAAQPVPPPKKKLAKA
jgi:transcription-repair coupling factor (superfamily II helicase)